VLGCREGKLQDRIDLRGKEVETLGKREREEEEEEEEIEERGNGKESVWGWGEVKRREKKTKAN
jgi:hypothetical protein